MGEQRSTAPGPMATKASDPLLCTLLLCADCVVGALGRAWGGGKAADLLAASRRRLEIRVAVASRTRSHRGGLTAGHCQDPAPASSSPALPPRSWPVPSPRALRDAPAQAGRGALHDEPLGLSVACGPSRRAWCCG